MSNVSIEIVGDWQLVRRVKPGDSWHPATDNLRGCDVYGSYVNDSTANATFSIPYDIDQVEYFKFATGDGEKWLIASVFAVMNNGTWFEDGNLDNGTTCNVYRDIEKSSISQTPYQAKWCKRANVKEDPWISLTDHNDSAANGDILYGENSWNANNHPKNSLTLHNGANVYIRKKGFLFSLLILYKTIIQMFSMLSRQ